MVSPGLPSILSRVVSEVTQNEKEAPGQVFQDVAAEWFRESLVRLPNLALGAKNNELLTA